MDGLVGGKAEFAAQPGIDVIAEITGAPQVNPLEICVGGTLTAALLAYLNETGEDLVRSATLLDTLVDFSEPGALGLVADEATVSYLERKLDRRGYLKGGEMAHTFDLLRGNDLVWNHVASGWLLGEDPPAFDLPAWNSDSTRMPAAMHSDYLRKCYLENALARDVLDLAGTTLRVSDIPNDMYVLGAAEDHIVPWQSSYRSTQLASGDTRLVLTSSGHIAGMVNPPSPKARFWANERTPADPEEWRQGSEEHDDTWWSDWIEWAGERSGEKRTPPSMGAIHTHPWSRLRGRTSSADRRSAAVWIRS